MTGPSFTVADVLEWARTKPADERYCYSASGNCALAQFIVETGRSSRTSVCSAGWCKWENGRLSDRIPYPAELEGPLISCDTFGELVKRLEALVQEAPVAPSPWLSPQTYIDCDCGQVSA